MSRTTWICVVVLCVLGLLARDVFTRGIPTLLTVTILLTPVAIWLWVRQRELAIMVLLFFGVWVGMFGLGLLLEWLFNSGPPGGGTGMPPMPLAFLCGLFLGWIPAAIVTTVVAVKRAKRSPRLPPPSSNWWW